MIDFILFVAIDLMGGKVIRLRQGDPSTKKIYSSNPAEIARDWLQKGASWLHVVNLDGALERQGTQNMEALRTVLNVKKEFGAHVQFGGGIRSFIDIEYLFSIGVDRVVLGTMAIENPHLLQQALQQFGNEKIALALDTRNGMVQVKGWQQETSYNPIEFTNKVEGLKWIITTDIARDGLQTGINMEATLQLARDTGLYTVASGGVACAEDIFRVKEAGLQGVIIGKALYEGAIDLTDVLFKLSQIPGK